jgi:type II secretory pathway component GspD/PulD (secretin)
VLIAFAYPGFPQDDNPDELIEFNPPPELELNLLIQMVSDELSLKIMVDERVGNQRVRLLVPESIPRSSMRGLLESALQMKGFALTKGNQPGWLRVVEAKDLLDISPPPEDADDDAGERKATAALTRVFSLEHYDPQKAEQVVRPYLTQPGGNLQVIADQQLLIVTDYAPRVARIGKVLDLIDQPARDVEVRFHKVKHLEAGEASTELSRILQARRRAETTGVSGQAQVGALPFEILHQPRTNNLVLIGESDQLDAALEMLKSIDIDLGLETRLYRFSSVSPGKVNGLVENLIDPSAKQRLYRSSMDEANGLLIVTTTPAIHEQVAAVQKDLDREIESTQPVLKYYKLKNAKANEVLGTISQLAGVTLFTYDPAGDGVQDGAAAPAVENELTPEEIARRRKERRLTEPSGEALNWGGDQPNLRGLMSSQAAVETEDAKLITDENTNTIIVYAEASRQAFYAELIEQLDKRRPQVMVEVTLVAVNTSEGKSIGVEISRTGDADDEPRVLSFSNFGLADSTDPADLLAASGLGFNGVILSEDIANVVLRALKTDGQSRVISTPKLLVNDNADGQLSSTLNIPFRSTNFNDDVRTETVGGSSNAGTVIGLLPQISEGDHIKLAYNIEFSSFGDGGSETLPPPKSSQNISSDVTIPDGHTIVIGGLNSTELGESVSRVPILGEIPILKYLFSSRSNTSSETTFFVFIKPLIMRDDDFAALRHMTRVDLERAGLPGDYPVSEPLMME